MGVEFVALMMIPLCAVLGCIFLAALWMILRGGGRKATRATHDEETRLIQDIYHGLIKMEERVEALETLLLERERKGGGVS
ncbi:MAG: envelope stress response membrane protein PspB [Candidatus Hydrogenedentes bacterium]|nr:envelope stress response membrane protein PspB [Candidatus Hydrogenedentota bacterium]